jgi:hypothetical protein
MTLRTSPHAVARVAQSDQDDDDGETRQRHGIGDPEHQRDHEVRQPGGPFRRGGGFVLAVPPATADLLPNSVESGHSLDCTTEGTIPPLPVRNEPDSERASTGIRLV